MSVLAGEEEGGGVGGGAQHQCNSQIDHSNVWTTRLSEEQPYWLDLTNQNFKWAEFLGSDDQ